MAIEADTPLALLLAILACLAAGCQVERSFELVTDPPGAEVRIDKTAVGVTPIVVPFDHYGTRRLTYYKEGYLTQSKVVSIRPPWYAHFPLDVVSELLLGWAWKDVRRIEAALVSETERLTQEDVETLLERAETLRSAGPSGPRGAPQ